MSFFEKTIFTGFSPNLRKKELNIALNFLINPLKWITIIKGDEEKKVKEYLETKFKNHKVTLFDSGRTSLNIALQALGATKDDEILVQAYTCMVVSNAINFTGAKPVYVDIKNDFNMDPDDLRKKITPRSKVIIIQHTFGKPADLDKIIKIAKENNLKIIEDCAHSIGAKHKDNLLGTFSDIAMFSFGSDKVISCNRGGALITKDNYIHKKINDYQRNLPLPKLNKTITHLIHYPIFYIGKKLYSIKIGKILLATTKKLNLTNKIIYKKEKTGERVSFYPSKLANSLAKILYSQLQDLEENIKHRKKIATIYNKQLNNQKIIKPRFDNESLFLRYAILSSKPEKIKSYAKKENIILGDWYNQAIAPRGVDIKSSHYIAGSCPKAEEISSKSINLPTNINITVDDANRIVNLINKF